MSVYDCQNELIYKVIKLNNNNNNSNKLKCIWYICYYEL